MIDFNNTYVQNAIKASLITLGLLAVFLLSKTVTEIISWSNNDIYPSKTITVNAQGEALAVADIASFSFSVNEEGATSEEAQKKATDKMNKALDYLKKNGVEDKDIKTQNYSINPKYNNGTPCYGYPCTPSEPKIIGYTVSQSVGVRVREVDNAGKFLSELTQFEINNISGISFTIDDEDILRNQAQNNAIDKAKIKAEILAKDLGVRLGDVISFGDDGQTPMPYAADYARPEMMSMKANVAPQIPQGENKYTSNVYITYELK
jgi:uncharacterized protein YggE